MEQTKIKYRTLIIDNELLARQRLRILLNSFNSEIEIIGEAENGIQAVELIDKLLPDLIFLDIQMPGKTGFEVLSSINHNPIVIFCTAYDDFALKAFETSSIDYIVKPIKEERLRKSIKKLNHLKSNSSNIELLSIINEYTNSVKKEEITSIPIKIGDRVIFIKMDDISYFSSTNKYVTINTKYGKEYIIDYSLRHLEERLGSKFIRVQRAYLINTKMIKEVNRYFGNRFIIVLEDVNNTKITTGRKYNDVVKKITEF